MDQTTVPNNPYQLPNSPPPPPPQSSQPNYYAGFVPPSPPPSQSKVFTPQPQSKAGVNKNLLVVGVLVLMLAGLVVGFGQARTFLSKAEGSCAPENLTETNLTPNSVEIVFSTAKACKTSVSYGLSADSLLLLVEEPMASLNHRVRLAPLVPGKSYYYQVKDGEGKEIGTVRSFLTKEAVTPTTPPTQPPVIATPTLVSSEKKTIEDFSAHYGETTNSTNKSFDLNNDGVINGVDWNLYLKSQK